MKIEIRKNCKFCGNPITKKRYRLYCSQECRNKVNNLKYKDKMAEWQRKSQDKKHSIQRPGTIQCKICGRWYVQVGTHTYLRHGLTAREYREEYNLPVKKGIVPTWYSKKKGDTALRNGTWKNLEMGKKFWYKKGDERAKAQTYWKGKLGGSKDKMRKKIYGE